MKNGQIQVLELELDALKNALKGKEAKYKASKEEKKKLHQDMDTYQDAIMKKHADMNAVTNNFGKIKDELEEKLKSKDQNPPSQGIQAPKKMKLPINALKSIKVRYWNKVIPILSFLNSIWEYVLYYENKMEEYKFALDAGSRIAKMFVENTDYQGDELEDITYIDVYNTHDKILAIPWRR